MFITLVVTIIFFFFSGHHSVGAAWTYLGLLSHQSYQPTDLFRCNGYRNSGALFIPSWCNRSLREGSSEVTSSDMDSKFAPGSVSAPAVTTGWGWSEWGEWGGSCPEVCPGRCRRRGRYCNGVCKAGKVGTRILYTWLALNGETLGLVSVSSRD